jgi:hypothetical protein
MKQLLVPILTLSLLSATSVAEVVRLEPTQDPKAKYRLFNTHNIYTLLKLNTATGQIWQVHWGNTGHRFEALLNGEELVKAGDPGRFTLYPTDNIFTFILLDQRVGTTWQVQWGQDGERFVILIQ